MTPASAGEGGRWVAVGRVGRPHGLAGAFVVEAASDDPRRFAPGATVYVGREPAAVAESKRAGGRLVVRLDRDAPRGAVLEVPASELPEPGVGEYYVFQLLGLAVEEEGGRPLGRVRDVVPGVANDVLELEGGIALPMVEDCVRAIDLETGRIVVAPGFAPEG
ncbi:MAG TPA: ribosome maturation factor RimM [Gaiellaceae bacterium]|nr:ribosome maturation factor RimM [Gaiellaceae bacterium]